MNTTEIIEIYERSTKRIDTASTTFEAVISERVADAAFEELRSRGIRLYDPETLQYVGNQHKQAVPSYVEQQAAKFASEGKQEVTR